MGKHNLRRIVNLQKWEPMIKKYDIGIPTSEQNQGKQGEEGRKSTPTITTPPCLSPEVLKRDLEQLEQLKYRKLK